VHSDWAGRAPAARKGRRSGGGKSTSLGGGGGGWLFGFLYPKKEPTVVVDEKDRDVRSGASALAPSSCAPQGGATRTRTDTQAGTCASLLFGRLRGAKGERGLTDGDSSDDSSDSSSREGGAGLPAFCRARRLPVLATLLSLLVSGIVAAIVVLARGGGRSPDATDADARSAGPTSGPTETPWLKGCLCRPTAAGHGGSSDFTTELFFAINGAGYACAQGNRLSRAAAASAGLTVCAYPNPDKDLGGYELTGALDSFTVDLTSRAGTATSFDLTADPAVAVDVDEGGGLAALTLSRPIAEFPPFEVEPLGGEARVCSGVVLRDAQLSRPGLGEEGPPASAAAGGSGPSGGPAADGDRAGGSREPAEWGGVQVAGPVVGGGSEGGPAEAAAGGVGLTRPAAPGRGDASRGRADGGGGVQVVRPEARSSLEARGESFRDRRRDLAGPGARSLELLGRGRADGGSQGPGKEGAQLARPEAGREHRSSIREGLQLGRPEAGSTLGARDGPSQEGRGQGQDLAGPGARYFELFGQGQVRVDGESENPSEEEGAQLVRPEGAGRGGRDSIREGARPEGPATGSSGLESEGGVSDTETEGAAASPRRVGEVAEFCVSIAIGGEEDVPAPDAAVVPSGLQGERSAAWGCALAAKTSPATRLIPFLKSNDSFSSFPSFLYLR